MKKVRKYHFSGQALVELAFGASLFILITPFLIDFLVLIITANMNNSLAARVARACASQTSQANFATVATSIQSSYPTNSVIKSVQINAPTFSNTNQLITVTSVMTVNLPFGIPGFGQNGIVLNATASDPWVGVAPQ